MKKGFFLLLVSITLTAAVSSAQKHYFFSTLKAPLVDYLSMALHKNTDPQNVNFNAQSDADLPDGVLFDLGYGYNINRFLAIEAGAEIFGFNPMKESYKSNVGTDLYDRLQVYNTGIAAQLRPVFKINLNDEDVMLRLSCGFNYQKLYSSGSYLINQTGGPTGTLVVTNSSKSQSGFDWSVQPSAGIDLKMNDRFILGFDLTYYHVNWAKSTGSLAFANAQTFVVPGNQTANVFFAIRASVW